MPRWPGKGSNIVLLSNLLALNLHEIFPVRGSKRIPRAPLEKMSAACQYRPTGLMLTSETSLYTK
jgi:hypothetical protein